MITIVRIDTKARWSDVVIHNNAFYYTGVPGNLDTDVFEQTANTLAQTSAALEKQGSNKSNILDATIFLADKNGFAAVNKAWNAQIVVGHALVRCTIQAGLVNPKYKVEIKTVVAVQTLSRQNKSDSNLSAILVGSAQINQGLRYYS